MTLDYPTALEISSNALADALDANRAAPVPWCGEWKVQDVARHVGGLQHVIVGVVEGRPTANFSLFKTLQQPAVDDPALGPWLREGSAALVECLRSMPSETECWSFGPEHNVGFWKRRSAHEAFVHGWDVGASRGNTGARDRRRRRVRQCRRVPRSVREHDARRLRRAR